MNPEQFLLYNGEITRHETVNLSDLVTSDPFILTQRMWFGHGGIPLFNENISTLIRELNEMSASIPDFLLDARELRRITKRMLNKNRMYRSGVLTMKVFMGASETEYLITAKASEQTGFPFSAKGLLIHFSDFRKQSGTGIQSTEFGNQPLWNLEKALNKQTLFYNSLFLNDNNVVCDSIGANVYLLKKNKLITPSVNTGCYVDTIRSLIISAAGELDLKMQESEKIQRGEVTSSDEIFLASEDRGIEWVMGIENKRFIHQKADLICSRLNEMLKERALDSVK